MAADKFGLAAHHAHKIRIKAIPNRIQNICLIIGWSFSMTGSLVVEVRKQNAKRSET
jgi:hypothetical protein